MINFKKTKFLLSAPNIFTLPADIGTEVAFCGRSNAGKSSALNCLTAQKKLAFTSKTPGRTQLINVFCIEEDKKLIDLPGYGYAKVPLKLKLECQKSLTEYLEKRMALKGLVVLMDIRHPLKEMDINLIVWGIQAHLPILVLLTKSDKLKQQEKNKIYHSVVESLAQYGGDVQVLLFSSTKGFGRQKALAVLTDWLRNDEHNDNENHL